MDDFLRRYGEEGDDDGERVSADKGPADKGPLRPTSPLIGPSGQTSKFKPPAKPMPWRINTAADAAPIGQVPPMPTAQAPQWPIGLPPPAGPMRPTPVLAQGAGQKRKQPAIGQPLPMPSSSSSSTMTASETLADLRAEQAVAGMMHIPWQERGPVPERDDDGHVIDKWRGQRWRENSGRWANRGGRMRKWYQAYYTKKQAWGADEAAAYADVVCGKGSGNGGEGDGGKGGEGEADDDA
jgi:hypothetical protein